ncbi:MAG: TetR/AcrR family transcriptional regulator [Armatimonadetes bacterium]|nr:MAG: TetR/AcrR family transcriptional regulator [Armatimonadota bacterium]
MGVMTESTATLSRSETTASKIIDAAKTLFVARNYADVTTDMIASAAGVTKGGLYHHFPSKESIYSSMMLDDFESKQRLFSQSVDMKGTARERLARLTGDFLALPAEERQMAGLVRRDINIFTDGDRDRLVRAYQLALPNQIEAIIKDGIADGELAPADPRLLSWWFVSLVEVAVSRYADETLGNPETRLDRVLALFFEGAEAKPDPAMSDGGTT